MGVVRPVPSADVVPPGIGLEPVGPDLCGPVFSEAGFSGDGAPDAVFAEPPAAGGPALAAGPKFVVTVVREPGAGVTVLCPSAPGVEPPDLVAPVVEPPDPVAPGEEPPDPVAPGVRPPDRVAPGGSPDAPLLDEGAPAIGSPFAAAGAGGWPPGGVRPADGGPGFGRFRLGAARRPSERFRSGALMSASRAGRRS